MGKLIIKCGNIFDYLDGMDTIVNSNNQYMIYGSGICGQIFKKAIKHIKNRYFNILLVISYGNST